LLIDVLNDDSIFVRLQALETMLHMATFGHLKVQGTHMHMVNF
jgi:integrator complex subunit 4